MHVIVPPRPHCPAIGRRRALILTFPSMSLALRTLRPQSVPRPCSRRFGFSAFPLRPHALFFVFPSEAPSARPPDRGGDAPMHPSRLIALIAQIALPTSLCLSATATAQVVKTYTCATSGTSCNSPIPSNAPYSTFGNAISKLTPGDLRP